MAPRLALDGAGRDHALRDAKSWLPAQAGSARVSFNVIHARRFLYAMDHPDRL